MRYTCSICGVNSRTFSNLCTHIGFRHGPKLNIVCGIAGCQQTFKTASNYRSHGYRIHRDIVESRIIAAPPSSTEHASDAIQNLSHIDNQNSHDDIDLCFEFESNEDHEIDCGEVASSASNSTQISHQSLHEITTQAITDTFLKIKETHSLPGSVTRDIFSEFSALFKGFFDGLKKCGALNANFTDILDENFFNTLFQNISTEYRISDYVAQSKGYVQPISKRLNDTFEMHYVSIAETIRALFSQDDIVAEILDYLGKQPDRQLLSDFKDGFEYSSGVDRTNADVLSIPLIFYSDEFEVCNPIGSARIKHKLLAVYFTLACLPPALRSKRKFIFLNALVPDTARKALGYCDVLRPLIEELCSLKDSPITLPNGKSVLIKIIAFCGDNLSSHGIGGFQTSFSNGYICRFCRCKYGDVSSAFLEDDFVLRTPQSIAEDIALIPTNGATHGIKSRSALFDLGYESFHLSNTLPDVMHDFLEGVVPAVITVVIRKLREAHLVTLAHLNNLIKKFSFKLKGTGLNPFDIELSSKNLNEGRFKGTASQKWCLLIHLPLILYEVDIPEGNQAWDLMLMCREIGEIVLSDTIPACLLEHLKYLIYEHHSLMRILAPVSITPKFHFLVHYPHFIGSFGPPKRYWTMRFEAKHQYFKDLAKKCRNFKNLSLTLATRCQVLAAVMLNSPDFLENQDLVSGPGETLPLSGFAHTVSASLKDVSGVGFFEDEVVFNSSWVIYNGMKYEKGLILVIGAIQEDIPLLVRVEYIVDIRSQWYLGGVEIIPTNFNRKTWSYVCRETECYSFQRLHNLFSRTPMLHYVLHGLLHVVQVSIPSKN